MKSAALYATAGMLIQGVVRLILTVLIGRIFGPEVLADQSALLNFSVFVALFWPVPAGNTISRFLPVARNRGYDERVLLRAFNVSMAGASVVLTVAMLVFGISIGLSWDALVAGLIITVGYAWYCYARGAALGSHGAKRVLIGDVLSSVGAFALFLLVVIGDLGEFSVLSLGLGYAAFAFITYPRGQERVDADPELTRMAFRFASWNILSSVASQGLLLLALLMVRVLDTIAVAGIFSAAYSLATPAAQLGMALSQVTIPRFSHGEDITSLYDRTSLRILGLFTALCTVIFAIGVALAPWYVPLLYGDRYEDAVGFAQALLVAVFIYTIGLPPAAILLALGHAKAVGIITMGGFVVGATAMYIMHETMGPYGVVIALGIGVTITLAGLLLDGVRRRRQQAKVVDGLDLELIV